MVVRTKAENIRSFSNTIDRLSFELERLGVELKKSKATGRVFDNVIANLLNISSNSYAISKNRDKIPYYEIVLLASKKEYSGISLSYVFLCVYNEEEKSV